MTNFKFKVGDRVAERPRLNYNISKSPRGRELYQQNNKQRYGTVVDQFIRKDGRGANQKIIKVIWDGKQSPSDHQQMRLCFVNELDALTDKFLL